LVVFFRTIARYLPLLSLIALAPIAQAEQWTVPTAEELAMTSQPQVPGAPAVYLFREEITYDGIGTRSTYARIKVLTEAGRKYADVELKSFNSDEGGFSVNSIAGRTIHPDGTIIPFTSKPFKKLIEKGNGYREMARVFTLPGVEVGSIIEYRYDVQYEPNFAWYFIPKWYVQSDLFTRRAHFQWNSADSPITFTPFLRKGDEVKLTHIATGERKTELSVSDVPPAPSDEFMPPVESLSYRVLFYSTAYSTPDEYWKNEGKSWARECDKFIGPGSKVKAAVKNLVEATDAPDQKLRKIYAEVMKLDNTSYSRAHSAAEEKSLGLKEVKTADDIWERKRGSEDEIAELFVAMARAAGLKAHVMRVTNRDRNLFLPSYLSLLQLDDDIAIVNVDGKEQYFDPGQRYSPYGQLAWKHTLAGGLRQTDGGAQIAGTPEQGAREARTDRLADLTMDAHGDATGTVTMTYRGAPALEWRQNYLRGDAASLNRDLQAAMETRIPAGMDVRVKSIEKLDEYEEPLVVKYDVKGHIASGTGKRLLISSDIFEVNAKPVFPHEKRELAVYYDYASWVLDAVRITFPASLAVESIPAADQMQFEKSTSYTLHAESTATSVTVHRNLLIGDIVFDLTQFPNLRAFYNNLETKDQEPVVLKVTAPAAGGN
jgi:hypothetical protein